MLDLADCANLDSAFAGWLIRLQRQVTGVGGKLKLSCCPVVCRQSLEVMGLDGLLTFGDVAFPADAREVSVAGFDEGSPDAIAFMLQAHDDLAGLSPENESEFSPIADLLRRELQKRIPSDG